jgi:hypothetical protein
MPRGGRPRHLVVFIFPELAGNIDSAVDRAGVARGLHLLPIFGFPSTRWLLGSLAIGSLPTTPSWWSRR